MFTGQPLNNEQYGVQSVCLMRGAGIPAVPLEKAVQNDRMRLMVRKKKWISIKLQPE